MRNLFVKSPISVLDYQFIWTDWLQDTEFIQDYSITTGPASSITQSYIDDPGITVDSDNNDNGVITVWLRGGRAGNVYQVNCQITTSLGRTDEKTMCFAVVDKR